MGSGKCGYNSLGCGIRCVFILSVAVLAVLLDVIGNNGCGTLNCELVGVVAGVTAILCVLVNCTAVGRLVWGYSCWGCGRSGCSKFPKFNTGG